MGVSVGYALRPTIRSPACGKGRSRDRHEQSWRALYGHSEPWRCGDGLTAEGAIRTCATLTGILSPPSQGGAGVGSYGADATRDNRPTHPRPLPCQGGEEKAGTRCPTNSIPAKIRPCSLTAPASTHFPIEPAESQCVYPYLSPNLPPRTTPAKPPALDRAAASTQLPRNDHRIGAATRP